MQSTLAILLGYAIFSPSPRPDDIVFPDGLTPANNGGLMIIRQGGKTTFSLGGGIFQRHVKVVEATPAGPVVYRFTLPSNFQVSTSPLDVDLRPAGIWVEVPDEFSALYVEGELVRGRGKHRMLQSPPLAPGKSCWVRVRVASVFGDKLHIEERLILLQAGQAVNVTFNNGSSTLVVPVPPTAPVEPAKKP